nr:uncharacterized protein LOC115269400 [Aedes albopictus]
MREAAKPFEAVYPKAVEAIKFDFYVDDFLSGADDEEEASQLKEQVAEILSSAGFELRKWSSNNENLLPRNDEDGASPVPVKMLNDSETVKALGINWYPSDDEYGFKVNFSPSSINTKRQMISDSARLFDPFGWLASVTAKIKILYQHLWLFDVGWDDPLPAIVEGEWQAVKQSLSQLEAIRIPRCIFPCRGRIQLHGFCDASEQAYGAVVYARTTDDNGNVSVVLVAAKSRVAPIKQISLPRLELNGAHLLTDLMRQITEALPHVEVDHWAWTDSSIVLHWLASHPRKWKTFVANRTAAILEYLP